MTSTTARYARMKNKSQSRSKKHSSISRKYTLAICNNAYQQLLEHVPRAILTKYTKNVSSNIFHLLTNHKNKIIKAIDIANNIRNNINNGLNTACKHLQLDYDTLNTSKPIGTQSTISIIPEMNDADKLAATQYLIPPFIEIFRHLLTVSAFTKHFTPEEVTEATRILSIPVRNHIYRELHAAPVGIKLADTYARYGHEIDLTRKFPTTDFHALLFNSFTSYTILEMIEAEMNHVTICTLTDGGKQYPNFLYIFHNGRDMGEGHRSKARKESNHIIDYFEINMIAENILKRVVFLNRLLGRDNLPNRLIIFLTNAKKEVDDTLEAAAHFRTLNINTAVTNMRDIIIYRQEELYKSIFHELIHFHNLDFKMLPADIQQMMLETLTTTHNISLENEYLLYEAVTESLANTLNAIFLSSSISGFRDNVEKEIMFSTFQVGKILRVCGYASWEEFALLDGTVKNTKKQWRQDSCVFSYYVLKLYILLNLDNYWSHILDSGWRVQTSMRHFKHLLEIFEHGRQNRTLCQVINHLLRNQSSSSSRGKGKTGKDKQTKINKTLRMTCLDAKV